MEHHNADHRRIRQLESDFKQVVGMDTKQNECRCGYSVDDETLTTNHLADDDKGNHQRGTQDRRREARDEGIKPYQGEQKHLLQGLLPLLAVE